MDVCSARLREVLRSQPWPRPAAAPARKCRARVNARSWRAAAAANKWTQFLAHRREEQCAGDLPRSQGNLQRFHELAFFIAMKITRLERGRVFWQSFVRVPDADRSADQLAEPAVVKAGRERI